MGAAGVHVNFWSAAVRHVLHDMAREEDKDGKSPYELRW